MPATIKRSIQQVLRTYRAGRFLGPLRNFWQPPLACSGSNWQAITEVIAGIGVARLKLQMLFASSTPKKEVGMQTRFHFTILVTLPLRLSSSIHVVTD